MLPAAPQSYLHELIGSEQAQRATGADELLLLHVGLASFIERGDRHSPSA